METIYKTELHCHTNPGSRCSSQTPEETVEKYISHGYSTVCITNHLYGFADMDDINAWRREVASKYDAYERARAAGEGRLNVLFGLELRFAPHSNDYLVFGLDREYLDEAGSALILDGFKKFAGYARENGLLVIQAHPFRVGMTTIDPSLIEAYEVYNGHPFHDSHNAIAEAWASRHGKIMTSGTDHHDANHIPCGGIRTAEPVVSVDGLIKTLRSGKYDLIRENPYAALGRENYL